MINVIYLTFTSAFIGIDDYIISKVLQTMMRNKMYNLVQAKQKYKGGQRFTPANLQLNTQP